MRTLEHSGSGAFYFRELIRFLFVFIIMEPSGKIHSVDELRKLADGMLSRRPLDPSRRLPFFRGQADASWGVGPGLARIQGINSPSLIEHAEKHLIQRFQTEITNSNYQRRISLPPNPGIYGEDWYWLFQAQHCRLPTRLLDWSAEPNIALWFAVCDPDTDVKDGQLLILHYPEGDIISNNGRPPSYYSESPENVNGLWLFNPAIHSNGNYPDLLGERRRMIQKGKFTLQSYADSLKNLDEQAALTRRYEDTKWLNQPVIEKYIIPSQVKAGIRAELEEGNMSDEGIYVENDSTMNLIVENCKKSLII